MCRLIFEKNGKISGFNFDPGNAIRSSGKIEFLFTQTESNGMYRSISRIGDKMKECSFFCNKQDDIVSIMQRIRDALEKVDYTHYPVHSNGKIKVEVPFEGSVLKAYVNSFTSAVDTWYPVHPNWGDRLMEAFRNKSRV